jgi:hypothetical protein
MDISYDNERTMYGIAAGDYVHCETTRRESRDEQYRLWIEDGETGLIKVKRTIPAWEEETDE